ncbi:MAG: elongation factor G, partial [Anaerolineae bacterium]|nr:elongation factor G [Anaerolineae bacterium]
CFVNKMDRPGANFQRWIDMSVERVSGSPVKIQIPYGEGENFNGIVDLLDMVLVTYGNDLGTDIKRVEIPADFLPIAEKERAEMIDRIVESDEFLTEKFLMEEEITNEEIIAALREATIKGKLQPVLCGSALKNKGVQLMLDRVVDLLPSPLDVPSVKGVHPKTEEEIERHPTDEEPLAALVFKIITDRFGRLAFTRVYSGVLRTGTSVQNTTKGTSERIGRIVRMFADRREDVEEVRAGDIAAIINLKETFTGDTLAAPNDPIVLENISFPDPVIEVAVEPNSQADQDKMALALRRLAEEDPTFKVEVDDKLGQTKIKGMGELHLEILVDRMKREYGVQATVGRPRVAYREAITRHVRMDTTFKRQSGGKGQYARVVVEFEPMTEEDRATAVKENKDGNAEFLFVYITKGGSVPSEFILPTMNGIKETAQAGVIAGYPMVGVKAILVDGAFHDVDSSEMAFKIAGSMCLKDAVQKAGPVILEPSMKVEVVVPDEYTGSVVGDLSSRRGIIQSMQPRGLGISTITAQVPLGEMFGYATNIRNITQGRGSFTMEFDKYTLAPQSIAEEVIKGTL